jgi:hypothetical protein
VGEETPFGSFSITIRGEELALLSLVVEILIETRLLRMFPHIVHQVLQQQLGDLVSGHADPVERTGRSKGEEVRTSNGSRRKERTERLTKPAGLPSRREERSCGT